MTQNTGYVVQVSYEWVRTHLATTYVGCELSVKGDFLYTRDAWCETVTDSTYFFYSGANIYAEDKTLCTPVLTAATHKNIEAFHCLMQLMDLKDDQRNPIFKVLQVKKHQAETLTVSLHTLNISMIRSLISQIFFQQFLIADKKWGSTLIKSTDTLKNSVLHVAASENNLSAVTVLIEKKVQCHSKNVAEKTPLHLAAEKGHQEWVALKLSTEFMHSINKAYRCLI